MNARALALASLMAGVPVSAAAAGAGDTPAVSAGDMQRAKELFGEGQKLYKAGEYIKALAKFEEAYAVRPHPAISYNIGKCYEQLGENGKAMRAFRDYLRMQPEAKDKESVLDAIANLERRLKEKGLQQMLVFADPPTAKIEIDGKDLGVQPASTELTAGQHKIAVRAPGFESAERTFTMSISRAAEMTINLTPGSTPSIPPLSVAMKPPPDAPRKDAPPAATLTPPAAANASQVLEAAPEVTKGAPKRGRVLTWVAAGLAAGAAGGGVGMGLVSSAANTELHFQVHSQTDAQTYHDRAARFATGANIAYAAAAGLAITAVVLFFVEK